MTNNVHTIDSHQPVSPTDTPQLGVTYTVTVRATEQGQATQITGLPGDNDHDHDHHNDNRPSYTIVGHASHVPWLQPGDQVLALMTADGAVITHRLRSEAEVPPINIRMDQNGVATLEAPEGITLKSGQSEITLCADGHIRLDGQDITQFGEEAVKLFGATVKLN